MSMSDRIDPQSRQPLEALLDAMPGGFNAIVDLGQRRAALKQMLATIDIPENPDVLKENRSVPGPAGAPDLGVRIYRPIGSREPLPNRLPGIYFIHGGGMVLGDIDGEDAVATMLCDAVGAVVVSVEYRLAPEHPHPAPVEDCYAGLVWMAGQGAELGVEPTRLAIFGGSAGGGLTIATAMLARDRGGPAVAFMMPVYPMIDDRNESASSHEILDVGVWDRAANLEAWAWYLGGMAPDRYAAPARAEDLTGLPPTYIDVGTVDLFRDEDIAFAQRLMQSGVDCELHVSPGSYHASETLAPLAPLSHQIWSLRIRALKQALGR